MGSSVRKMLIVDDEQDICACMRDFFQTKGFKVICAYSGEEALARLAEQEVDVLLLDILLPGVSGIEVLRCVKESFPRVRIVMVTSVDREDVRAQAHQYGAAAFITKPFDFSNTTWSQVFI
ncbi:MAG: response regulator [Candidatus Omnitrophica bacterium]|nr:response regulator [Candidatus Omnitrophota bacterium]